MTFEPWVVLAVGAVVGGIGVGLLVGRARLLRQARAETAWMLVFLTGVALTVGGCGMVAYALIRMFGLLTMT